MMGSVTFCIALVVQLYAVANGAYPYYGKLISRGFGSGSSNGLSGDIYAVNENSFQIIDFVFDGAGESVVLVGTDKNYATASGSSEDTSAVAIDSSSSRGLRAYTGQTAVFSMPSSITLAKATYIAIYSQTDKQFLGGFDIPSNFDAPKSQTIGKFSTHAHSVTSGEVTVVDDRTIFIKRFRYDGQGPDAYFYVGTSSSVALQSSPYGKIPDEEGNSASKAKAYSDRDITLTLPDTMSVTDLRWLSMYCITYEHNFGEVFIPSNINVPPNMEIAINRTGLNCEPLNDKLQVSWVVDNNTITIELAGNIDRNSDYMAFGLSGSNTSVRMIGADVTVTDWVEGQDPRAVDYHLTAYSQCGATDGACPDTDPSNAGTNDTLQVSGEITNGIVRVKYQRNLVTGDSSNDIDFRIDGTPQQVVWAVGPLNSKGEAAKHYQGDKTSKATLIDFGRKIVTNCPAFKIKAERVKPDFIEQVLYGDEHNNTFTVEIGQSGSEQGYKAITGSPSWGIAWYVNGILVPRLYLKRGVEYTFLVGGGTDPSKGSMYHPFYLTTDRNGGKQLKENSTETVFPGILDGSPSPFGLGGYCEWKLKSEAIKKVDEGLIYNCFKEFRTDLYLDCASDKRYGIFTFTPNATTPNEIYYQCYTHQNLGWKIEVVDEYPEPRVRAKTGCEGVNHSVAHAHSLMILMFSAILLYAV